MVAGGAGKGGNGRVVAFGKGRRMEKTVPGVEAHAIFWQGDERGACARGLVNQAQAGGNVLFDVGRG